MPTESPWEGSRKEGVAGFATTRWSVVVAAGRVSSSESRQALETLCQTYWYPLYGYARRHVPQVEEARDLTQAFFAELLEKNTVEAATPTRGRFRAFLLTCFKHYLSKQWEHARAAKRGGGRAPLALDFESGESRFSLEPATQLTPEQLFDRQWALQLLNEVMHRLREEQLRDGKGEQFEHLKGVLIGEHSATYADIAHTLGTTEAAVKMAAHRLRRRYRELLREEIGQTVASPEDVDDEIASLFATFR